MTLSTHWGLRELGHFSLPSLWILLDNSYLGDPFILLARAKREGIPVLSTGAGCERGKGRRQKFHTLWHGPEDTGGETLEQQGRHKEKTCFKMKEIGSSPSGDCSLHEMLNEVLCIIKIKE